MSELIIKATDATFSQHILNSKLPVLVDFWAPWCSPCKALNPMLDRLASVYAGRLQIVKINVDENPEITKKLNIRGLPLLKIYVDGKCHVADAPRSQAGLIVLLDELVGPAENEYKNSDDEKSLRISFHGDAARKQDCISLLNAVALDEKNRPSVFFAMKYESFGNALGLPDKLCELLELIWRTRFKDVSTTEYAKNDLLTIIEAIPVGVDLRMLPLTMMNWLLHDAETGSLRHAPTEATKNMSKKLALLHSQEISDQHIVQHEEWLALQREAIELEESFKIIALPLESLEKTKLIAEKYFVQGLVDSAQPLAESEMHGNFYWPIALEGDLKVKDYWSEEEQQQWSDFHKSAWDIIDSSIGPRPSAEKVDEFKVWAEKANKLEDELQARFHREFPELAMRKKIWDTQYQHLASMYAQVVSLKLIEFLKQLKYTGSHD